MHERRTNSTRYNNERRRVKKLCRVIEKEGEKLYKMYLVQLRKKGVKNIINGNKTGV